MPDELVENEVAEVEQTAAEQEEQAEEERVLSGLEKLKQLDEEDTRVKVSLRTILGGDILTGSWFRKNFFFILFLVGLTIIYISALIYRVSSYELYTLFCKIISLLSFIIFRI